MKFQETFIKGLYVIQPVVFEDDRGYFFESFKSPAFKAQDIDVTFLQDNQSFSRNKGVLRGLHFQVPPFSQAKLVSVSKGSVLDVAVDIRRNSPTYGQHFSVELNDLAHTMLFIPEGFAHGFMTLEDNTIFTYKCSSAYHKVSERCIRWNDEQLDIQWGINKPILSDKDKEGLSFSEYVSDF